MRLILVEDDEKQYGSDLRLEAQIAKEIDFLEAKEIDNSKESLLSRYQDESSPSGFSRAVNESTKWPDASARVIIGRTDEFNALVEQWRYDTGVFSNAEQKAMHPAYQRIIGMGKEAIPLILQEMMVRPGHWFWALRAIPGENPVSAEHVGNIRAMTDDWVQWGMRRHLFRK